MEFKVGSRKGTVEVYPKDALHFARSVGVTQTASIQLYNNSTECIAYKLRTTCPAEIKFRPAYGFLQPFRMKEILVRCNVKEKNNEEQNSERCTLVAHVLPEGFKTGKAFDYWKSVMCTNLIDKAYRLEVKYDLDSYEVPEPVSSSSYTSSSIIATTSTEEESGTTTSSEYTSSTDKGTNSSTGSSSGTTADSSRDATSSTAEADSSAETSGTSVVSLESLTLGSEVTASNNSLAQEN
uniref:Major sperm protein n=1 Tax=Trichuris muris TaxID=70415 RepID=A0A5S6QS34_TRIMR